MLKKKQSPNIDGAVAHSVNFEVTIADLARRSERRAWIVAFCSLGMSLILAGGYFYMLPLKEKVPYLVMADPYSGTSSLARLTDSLVDQRITASEAVNRSNIAHFVLARESYDLALTNLRDWPTVLTMSSTTVAQPYLALHGQNNPSSPYNTYGKTKAIRVKILSIVLIGGGGNVTPKGATVRFQRSLYDKANGATSPLDSKIATMEFVYKTNLRMDDQSRVENPLGFQVTSYRVDNDFGSAAPQEVPVAPAAQPTVPVQPQSAVTDENGALVAPATATQPSVPAQEAPTTLAVPPSSIPGDGAYPAAPNGAAPVPLQPAAAPAAHTVPRSAANGGRR
jgi:type IV secretion system protein VirB8